MLSDIGSFTTSDVQYVAVSRNSDEAVKIAGQYFAPYDSFAATEVDDEITVAPPLAVLPDGYEMRNGVLYCPQQRSIDTRFQSYVKASDRLTRGAGTKQLQIHSLGFVTTLVDSPQKIDQLYSFLVSPTSAEA